MGWGTWNVLATMHFLGMTVVLFEGLPYFLSPTFLWDIVDEFKINIMFPPPSVLEDMIKKGYLPSNISASVYFCIYKQYNQ